MFLLNVHLSTVRQDLCRRPRREPASLEASKALGRGLSPAAAGESFGPGEISTKSGTEQPTDVQVSEVDILHHPYALRDRGTKMLWYPEHQDLKGICQQVARFQAADGEFRAEHQSSGGAREPGA